MRVNIETYERENGGYVAVAAFEGSLIENGRSAAHLDEDEAAKRALTLLLQDEALGGLLEPHTAKAATSLPSERREKNTAVIEDAIDNGWEVRFKYTDSQGLSTQRRVKPVRIDEDTWLSAFDLEKGEPRTFRIDGIIGAFPVR